MHDNRDAIEYPTYRRRGYFVGSSAIESANKTVIERRLKQAGMRLRADLAGRMLVLRCKLMSGLWDTDVAALARGEVPQVRVRRRQGLEGFERRLIIH